jgi:hypothetical protein
VGRAGDGAGEGVAGEVEAEEERGGRRGGRLGGPGRPAPAEAGERPSAPSLLAGGGGRWAVERPVVSIRYGLGGGAGSSGDASWNDPGRWGMVGPVREAGDDGFVGLGAAPIALGFRLGGGAKLSGSRKEEIGIETWSLRCVDCGELLTPRP